MGKKTDSYSNPDQTRRNGQQVSPEALAAFYRLRTESLTDSHTTQKASTKQMEATQALPAGMQPTQGIVDYVISALAGHPGYMPK